MQNHELHALQFIFIHIGFSIMSFKYFTSIDSVYHVHRSKYVYFADVCTIEMVGKLYVQLERGSHEMRRDKCLSYHPHLYGKDKHLQFENP